VGRLDGKVAIVSGAARGQGAAEARQFVAEGAKVVLGDVLHEEGELVAKELGDSARYVPLDVTDESAWANAVETATSTFGGLNILVNNAGVAHMPTPIAVMEPADYRRVIEINQIGTFLGMHAAIPAIVRGAPGAIVNISSVNGFVGAAGMSAYVSTKFAVRGMTQCAALELAPANVRVNSVHPGPIDTAMIQPETFGGFDIRPMLDKTVPMGRCGRPDEVAELVTWLASDASSYCTGAQFVIDGGFITWDNTFNP
jgi:3alpha(or 20beta)-hydroxysteroid dehydrogenase